MMFPKWPGCIYIITLLIVPICGYGTTIVNAPLPSVSFELPERWNNLPPTALKQYEALLAQRIVEEGEHPRLLHTLGMALYRQGRTDEARRLWTRAAGENPNLAPGDLMADYVDFQRLLEKGETREAQIKLKQLRKRYESTVHFQLFRAEQAMRSNNLKEAEKSYKKAYELGPGLYVTSLNLARYYDATSDKAQAENYYRKALDQGDDCGECWSFHANFQYRLGDIKESLISFRKAAELDPMQPAAELRLATLSRTRGDFIGARYWYRSALEQKLADETAIRVALSDVLLKLNLLDEARRNAEDILAKRKVAPVMLVLAGIEAAQGNLDGAKALYLKVLAQDPLNVIANNNLAMLLIRSAGGSQEALKHAQTALEQESDNPLVLSTLGCALFRAQEKGAEEQLLKAVQRLPADPWARYCYGMQLMANGKKAEARLHLEGALILDPAFPLADEIRMVLKAE